MSSANCYDVADLTQFATALLTKAGMPADRAVEVAGVLVEGDLLGHDTHGLQLLGQYLAEIEAGAMALTGDPEVINDRGAVVTWDGMRLPGPWLVLRAFEVAATRAARHGAGTVVIRRSHHIACLAAYLARATERGLVMLLLSSDPNVCSVAPFGGTRAVFTPNPIAAGFPTAGDPVLLDVSCSITTNGLTNRLYKEGKTLPHEWLLDADGRASNDPAVLFTDPPGTILPLGGFDVGHKGYALMLLVEALTGGLAGFGRADPKQGWGATVFLQVLDPEAFAGREDFQRQTTWVADACRNNPPRAGFDAVRVPGQKGLARKAAQLREGAELHPGIMPQLAPWAEKLGVPLPEPL
jgi:LDH2 family malate/lactate/ureidoglycolate dehydrogenase